MGTYYEYVLRKKGLRLSHEQKVCRNDQKMPPEFRWITPRGEMLDELKDDRKAFNEDGWRICASCKVAQPPESYHNNKNNIDGKDARCKICKSLLAKERYKVVK